MMIFNLSRLLPAPSQRVYDREDDEAVSKLQTSVSL